MLVILERPKADGDRGSNRPAPLFGAGISPSDGAAGAASRGGGGTTRPSKRGDSGSSGVARSQDREEASKARAAVRASADTGTSAAPQTAGVVAAVLLLGGMLGLVLRRLNRGRLD